MPALCSFSRRRVEPISMAPNHSVFDLTIKKEQAQANFRSGKGRNHTRAQPRLKDPAVFT